MLSGWLDNGGRAYLDAHGRDGVDLVEQTDREAAAAERRAHRLVDRFLDQVAGRDVVALAASPETSS